MSTLFSVLTVLGLSWPDTLFLSAVVLMLGWPWLLAGWALWRLRRASPAGGLGRAYLLANYSAAVQLSNLRGEQVLTILVYLICFQIIGIYSALQLLVLGRSVPVLLGLMGVAVAGWAAYRYADPAVRGCYRTWRTATALEVYLPAQRRAWGLLGHALFWGAFTFIFICISLRGKLETYL